MLLVGSFEPFDEAEARRVGANDNLTKPFQSIRRLIEKVGLLASNRPPEEQIPTAELPKPDDEREPPVEKLSTAELEMTTADTQPLPPELRHVVEQAAASQAAQDQVSSAAGAEKSESRESRMETVDPSSSSQQQAAGEIRGGEVLLDLGDFKPARAAVTDDFVLDLDLDEAPEPSPAESAFAGSAFLSKPSRWRRPTSWPRRWSFSGLRTNQSKPRRSMKWKAPWTMPCRTRLLRLSLNQLLWISIRLLRQLPAKFRLSSYRRR
jgi:CheY-like chemotaxis protein